MKINYTLINWYFISVLLFTNVLANENKKFSTMGYTFESTHNIENSKKLSKFTLDSEECLKRANDQYKKNIENYETLAKVYGSLLNDALLKKMEKSQFLDCMTGNKTGAKESKGWTLIE
jgi:hypothetical protein